MHCFLLFCFSDDVSMPAFCSNLAGRCRACAVFGLWTNEDLVQLHFGIPFELWVVFADLRGNDLLDKLLTFFTFISFTKLKERDFMENPLFFLEALFFEAWFHLDICPAQKASDDINKYSNQTLCIYLLVSDWGWGIVWSQMNSLSSSNLQLIHINHINNNKLQIGTELLSPKLLSRTSCRGPLC